MAIEQVCETTIGRHRVSVRLHDRAIVTVSMTTEGGFGDADEAEQVGRMLIAAAERARAVEAQLRQLEAAVRGEEPGR